MKRRNPDEFHSRSAQNIVRRRGKVLQRVRARLTSAIVLTFLLIVPLPAWAAMSVLSDSFFGSEPIAVGLHARCLGTVSDLINLHKRQYMLVEPVTVSETGDYFIVSPTSRIGVNVWFGIYKGGFDPAEPYLNRIAQFPPPVGQQNNEDTGAQVNLHSGTEYQLVTSPKCMLDPGDGLKRGVWNLVVKGPGQMHSPATVTALDEFIHGEFDGTGPTADIGCGAAEFHSSGAQQVDTSGRYYITDASPLFGADACIAVYSAPFDPARPADNRIASVLDRFSLTLTLHEGEDYYFVVTPNAEATAAEDIEYFYLITPGTDVRIDPVLSGAWHDPGTPGQGFFIDVLGHERLLFLGWFTYDLQRPAEGAQAFMGDPGHRWLTAFGSFSSASATLDLEVTTGGVFNQGANVNQTFDGWLELEFFDCNTAQVTYDLGTAGAAGVLPIQRVSNINSRACELLMSQSGTPRKLNRDG